MRIAVDTGGTFVDAVMAAVDGSLRFFKSQSTPGDYLDGLMAAIEPWSSELGQCNRFVHGSTVCHNALIEGRLPRLAMVTTAGFRDVIEIQRANRTNIYDPLFKKPEPLVPRSMRFEVQERIAADGSVLVDLDEDELEPLVRSLREACPEAVAVCLINSYANAAHEVKLGEALADAGFSNVCTSYSLSREYREYERSCTVALNASLMPVMSKYLGSLTDRLSYSGLKRDLYFMQSNGGICRSQSVESRPIETVNSGPAGGVVASATLAKILGEPNVIGTDMGGTSFDVCVIVDGAYRTLPIMELTTAHSGDGTYPVQIPTLETNAIGAGGGSVVWLDGGGLLHVGPRSAGAIPGPACYGYGGQEPTVTDLNLVLHRLNPRRFLGGRMTISPRLARKALEPVAAALNMPVEETADGALAVAVNNMANAIRTMTVQRGIDPRGFTLVSAGGAGPLHASLIARELQIPRIIIPPQPANFAAWGMLCTDFKHELSRTYIGPLGEVDPGDLTSAYGSLEREAARMLAADGVSEGEQVFLRAMLVRYVGQGHALEVPLRLGALIRNDWSDVADVFDRMHLSAYSQNAPDESKELVGIKLTAIGRVLHAVLPQVEKGPRAPRSTSRRQARLLHFEGESIECPVFNRAMLRAGNEFTGPTIVEEEACTAFILPDQYCLVDEYGNLILESA